MQTDSGVIRSTFGMFVAGILKLDERDGVRIVETKRNGTSARVVVDVQRDEMKAMLSELVDIMNGEKSGSYTRDQRRAIAKALGDTSEALGDVAPTYAITGDHNVVIAVEVDEQLEAIERRNVIGAEQIAEQKLENQRIVDDVRSLVGFDVAASDVEVISAPVTLTKLGREALAASQANDVAPVADRPAPRSGGAESDIVRAARERLERTETKLAAAIVDQRPKGTIAAFRANVTRQQTAYLMAVNTDRQSS